MRYAINVPNFGDYADPETFVRLARHAEASGWDALFVWDHLLVDPDWGVPIADPWILLAAAATATERLRLGPMVTPLPRRRPWVVARQSATLDHLSRGRLTLGVGIGAPAGAEFGAFGEDASVQGRAVRLDEGLAILDGLWSGERFSHHGLHHRLEPMRFAPRPIQRPRPPIWLAAYWPHRGAFRRAAHWDGVFPATVRTEQTGEMITPEELRAGLRVIAEERGDRGLVGYDVMVAGGTPPDSSAAEEILAPYREAGATWWSEGLSAWRGSLSEMEERVLAGPPRVPARA